MKALALAIIDFYQKYLSPLKGYRCAYGVLHGSTTCSAAIKTAIIKHGLIDGLPHIRQQFRACSSAADILNKTASQNNSSRKKPKDKWHNHCDCSSCDFDLF